MLPGIYLRLAYPLAQRLRRNDVQIRPDRPDRRILELIVAAVLDGYQAHRPLT